MESSIPPRRDRGDLLARPPYRSRMDGSGWAALIVDASGQLEALADLLDRGLLSEREYAREKAKVIDP